MMLDRVVIYCEGGKVRDRATGRIQYAKHKKPFEFVFDRESDGRWIPLHQVNLGDPGASESDLLASRVEDLNVQWERATAHGWVEVPPDAVPAYKMATPDRVVRTRGQNPVLVSRVRGGVRLSKRGYELECAAHTLDDGLLGVSFGQLRRVLDTLSEHGFDTLDLDTFIRRVRSRR